MRKPESSSRNAIGITKIMTASVLLFAGNAAAQTAKPVKLECESLITPLGMDAAKPQLSWKIRDWRRKSGNARQR
jgi:hypothetical protein